MVSETEFPCTDATEASDNVTSLVSDVTCPVDIRFKEPRSEAFVTEDKPHEQNFNIQDCKCYEIGYPSAVNRGVDAAAKPYGVSGNVAEQFPRQNASKEQNVSTRLFEPGAPCLCHSHKIDSNHTVPVKFRKDIAYSRPFWCRFKWKWPRKGYFEKKDKTYEVKLKRKQCPHYTQPFICCEISEGIPNTNKYQYVKAGPPKYQEKPKDKKNGITEKIDVYYFDHGNSAYYRTTDSPPIIASEKCAEKTDQAATRFWAEIFGTIHIGTAFVTAFILQLLRFVLVSIIRPLTVGILQLLADYFTKPFLSIVFNALIQPVMILLYNIATSLKDLCEPIAEAMGLFLREIANLCAAIRIVEVRQGLNTPTTNTCSS